MTHAETRIITVGIAGSLAVHLLAGLLLATWIAYAPAEHRVPRPVDPPMEVILPTNIEVAPPPAPAPAPLPEPAKPAPPPPRRYIDTADNETADKAPQKAAFISDRNTVASAKTAPDPKADQDLPTMKGVKVPTLDMANREYKDGEIKDERSLASPKSPPPAPPPTPKAEPKPPPPPPKAEPLPPPEKMAKKDDSPAEKMMKELDAALEKDSKEPPPPEVRKPAEPKDKTPDMKLPEEPPLPQTMPLPPPSPASRQRPDKEEFVPQKRTSEVKGRISNIGGSDSVDAAETAEGRYVKQVKAAIQKRWLFHTTQRGDFLQPCDIVVQFSITRDGKPKDVKILSSNGNAVITDFTLGSVLEAKIPPIPEDLRRQMASDVFEMPMEFVVY